jgi:hypothetical protein
MILPNNDSALSSSGKMMVGKNHLEFTCGEATADGKHSIAEG